MDNKPYEVLKKIKTEYYVYEEPEEMIQMYNSWAEKYEEDTDTIGYTIHNTSAEVLMRIIGGESDKVVLDVLCGTGLVGFHLRRRGFSGTLHGLDGSHGMLKLAAAKQVYQTLTKQRLEPSQGQVLDGKFSNLDAITCVGGFLIGHLDAKMLPHLAELLKPGGYLLYTAREGQNNDRYRQSVEEETRKLVESGILKSKEIVKTSHGVDWDVEEYDHVKTEDHIPSSVCVYCYEKC